MATPKRKRATDKRRAKRKQRKKAPQQRTSAARFSIERPDIRREVEHITRLAQAADARIVTVENLVLFSTETGDAWLLDRDDDLAHCVCRGGQPQPIRIIDQPDAFGIEWSAHFSIEETEFMVRERSGRISVIHGYPTDAIALACWG